MTVYFCNEEPIDLDVIRLMGVSVKGTESPIGYFGTGLKFAIAVLLRTGHKVAIHRAGTEHHLGLEESEIRGTTFKVVTLDGDRLGFTTDLGRNWEVWQAYRELHSNCLDESGTIDTAIPEGSWGTVVTVEGADFLRAYHNRHEIFLSSRPLVKNSHAEVHTGSNTHGFYRRIRAYDLEQPSLYTYNVVADVGLTEDRNVKNQYVYRYWCAHAIAESSDEELIHKALFAGDFLEGQFDYLPHADDASDVFLRVVGENKDNVHISKTAYKAWLKRTGSTQSYAVADTSELDEKEIGKALSLLRWVDCDLGRDEFQVVRTLGEGVFGAVRGGNILIARKTIDRGERFIASTLYEEWLHKTQGLRDESRGMQDALLDRMMCLASELSIVRESR